MLQPIKDRIFATKVVAPDRTAGGLFVPTPENQNTYKAEVKYVGPYATEWLSPGDIVVLGKFTGETVTVDGEDFLIFSFDDILAIMLNNR